MGERSNSKGTTGRRRRRLLAAVIAFPIVALLGYDGAVAISIELEERGRLRDQEMRRHVEPIDIPGDREKPACLLLHGFGNLPVDWYPLIEPLKARGIGMYGPCLRGHNGATARDLASVTAAEWVEDGHRALDRLTQEYPSVDVVGFSLGALLAMELVDRPEVRRLVLISPYTEVPSHWFYGLKPGTWVQLLSPAVPYVRRFKPGQINDPAGVARYVSAYDHLSLNAVVELDRYAQDVWTRVEPITKTSLIIYSKGDAVSSSRSTEKAIGRVFLDSADHRVEVLERSNHIILYDWSSSDMVAEIMRFLDQDRDESARDEQPEERS